MYGKIYFRKEQTLTVTEFAKEREVDNQLPRKYIDRHPELFESHISKKGREVDFDDVAYEILDKKYPLPKPIEIIEDTESRAKLIKAQEIIIKLQNTINEQATMIAQAEAQNMLLEDRTEQLHEIKTEKAAVDQELNDVKVKLSDTKSELDKFKKTFLGFYKKIE